MPDGLYEKDALAWAEQQSDLLSPWCFLADGVRHKPTIDFKQAITTETKCFAFVFRHRARDRIESPDDLTVFRLLFVIAIDCLL